MTQSGRERTLRVLTSVQFSSFLSIGADIIITIDPHKASLG
jgi:hypothetical protein